MARISFFRIFFPKKIRYPKAAKATAVLTNTVELAMDVLLQGLKPYHKVHGQEQARKAAESQIPFPFLRKAALSWSPFWKK